MISSWSHNCLTSKEHYRFRKYRKHRIQIGKTANGPTWLIKGKQLYVDCRYIILSQYLMNTRHLCVNFVFLANREYHKDTSHFRGWKVCVQRPNSWTNPRQKSWEFSFLLFTITSTDLPWYFYFFKLTQPLTVSTVQLQLLYIVKEKGGKPDRKLYTLPYGLRNPYRNLKYENSQNEAQKLSVHEFGFCGDTENSAPPLSHQNFSVAPNAILAPSPLPMSVNWFLTTPIQIIFVTS